jgi:putative transposase
MSLKIDFVERARKGENLSKLCREFGISRTTGHKWVRRFREHGYAGLEEESRRPKSAPLATAEDIVLAVLEAREKHPSWGPKKLEVVLRRRFLDQAPSERTVARILKRAELVRAKRKRRPVSVIERVPHVQAERPNDVWTVDFKGWWRSLDNSRCEPLTVRDAFSRFVFAVVLCTTKAVDVRPVFEQLFRRYGVPRAIQCDNGTPFISVRAPAGLSKLSAWWVSLGIQLVRSRPACPQDNGGHERMHRDLRRDVQLAPANTREHQQRALDKWRQEFNQVRPHEALDGKTPAEVYRSAQKAEAPLANYEYDSALRRARVSSCGTFNLCGARHFLSEALAGHDVALERVNTLQVRVWFHGIDLGLIEVEPVVDDTVYLSTKRKTEAA